MVDEQESTCLIWRLIWLGYVGNRMYGFWDVWYGRIRSLFPWNALGAITVKAVVPFHLRATLRLDVRSLRHA